MDSLRGGREKRQGNKRVRRNGEGKRRREEGMEGEGGEDKRRGKRRGREGVCKEDGSHVMTGSKIHKL